MKYLHLLMALLFAITAALQINDPDPLYWVATYGATAATAGTAFFGVRLRTLLLVTLGMAVGGLLISMPGTGDYFAANDYGSIYQSMSGDKPYIESAREFGGLLVAIVYLSVFAVLWRR